MRSVGYNGERGTQLWVGERKKPGFVGPGENFAFGGNEWWLSHILIWRICYLISSYGYLICSSASTTASEDGPESTGCNNHRGNVRPSGVLRNSPYPDIYTRPFCWFPGV